MTKVIILGQEENKQTKKPIEFVKFLGSGLDVYDADEISEPKEWVNIELISRNYSNGMDLMFAYDEDRNDKSSTLYLGYFNDGVVF